MDDNKITYFAETDARNKRVPFGIKREDRSRHMYVIGKTGMGKSTALENMAIQDIKNGEGMAFIDPHGKTADLLLDYVPQERIQDVLYFAPFDLDHPISFNVMEDVGHDKRHLVANGLMSAFKKIWVDAWSARMEYILNNVLLALLEYPDATLVGVNRMLVDKEYRKRVVDNITDPSVKAFWTDEFAKYGPNYMQEAGAAIQNKIGQFISNPLVRNIIGQSRSSFDLRKMMDEKKIIIVNLSKGRVGEANANLLGSMLITKIYLAAMSRADASPGLMKKLPFFQLYVDEFQSFANESFADILSEARKYRLSLTIAHQYIEQMSDEVRAAVFGNVGTMVSFRVGAYDAEVLEKEYAPIFTQQDLVNLGFAQIYLKLMIDGVSSQPFSAVTLPPIEKPLVSFKEEILRYSRSTFARPRPEVEEAIKKWHEPSLAEGPLQQGRRLGEGGGPQREGREGRERRDDREKRNQSSEQKSPGEIQAIRESQETELRKIISLNYSKAEKPEKKKEQSKKNKGPTTENMSALRSALASVLQEAQQNQGQSQSAPQPKPQQPAHAPHQAPQPTQPQPHTHQSHQQHKESEPKPQPQSPHSHNQSEHRKPVRKHREVPEEVLRQILELDK